MSDAGEYGKGAKKRSCSTTLFRVFKSWEMLCCLYVLQCRQAHGKWVRLINPDAATDLNWRLMASGQL